ncbi:SCO family protein [uncultured Polaribacter sp.]|uniref:SCO family protein n=1 Tax=uncultured Polaribacter sp. TaxID=174711 RepID=UPI0026024DCC|nr:SCO family protein [uncultured Polaribacter sp.]
MNKLVILFALAVFLCSCKREKLPILGETSVNAITGDIVYYKAPDFELTNQLNSISTAIDFQHKIKVVDFFFTSCPTICPQMTKHLKLVEEAYKDEDRVAIISYSIDPKNDTPKRLQAYAENHNIDTNKWTFLTGNSEAIFELSKDYKVRAFDDSSNEERNLIHDGTFVLVDGQQRLRGYYNGLQVEDTQRLIKDISILLKE